MRIRQELPADYAEVYSLIREAFATAEHADGNEQDLVAALRQSDAFLPELSLVAEIDGVLAGHILFTKAHVGQTVVLVLAPLSVKPAFQRQGVGSALIQKGHRIAAHLGYSYIMVLGSERYYPRFGYGPAADLGVTVPSGIPSRNFMVLQLQRAQPLQGALVYARAFYAAPGTASQPTP